MSSRSHPSPGTPNSFFLLFACSWSQSPHHCSRCRQYYDIHDHTYRMTEKEGQTIQLFSQSTVSAADHENAIGLLHVLREVRLEVLVFAIPVVVGLIFLESFFPKLPFVVVFNILRTQILFHPPTFLFPSNSLCRQSRGYFHFLISVIFHSRYINVPF